jgi:hypothetical protein
MIDSTNFSKTGRGSEKSFGIVFTIVFLLFALYPITNSKDINLWALIIAVILLMLSFIKPKALSFLNILWYKFGLMLGRITSPIVMFLIYFVTVVPTGLIMKLLGKDLLSQKLNKNLNSYWIKRDKSIGSMKNQF